MSGKTGAYQNLLLWHTITADPLSVSTMQGSQPYRYLGGENIQAKRTMALWSGSLINLRQAQKGRQWEGREKDGEWGHAR